MGREEVMIRNLKIGARTVLIFGLLGVIVLVLGAYSGRI
jgi:hypothetical protein